MKKPIVFLASIALMTAFSVSSCDLLDDLLDIRFTTDWIHVTFEVTARDAGYHTLSEIRTESDLKQQISDNGGDISNLNNVVVDSAYISVVSPGRTLDPFEEIEVYLFTPSNPTLRLIASGAVGNTGETFQGLDVVTTSLTELLVEDFYFVHVKALLDQDLTEDIDLEVSLRYDVEVAP